MTRAIGDQDPAIDTGLRKLAREIQLLAVLELAADHANVHYGASQLIVDRSADATSADIQAVLDDTVQVDLWDLDPLLWDDANWAAMQYVPAGHICLISPPHRD